MVRASDGEFKVLTGNQTGVLLLDYLIGAMKRAGKLPEKPVALQTIVTTEMARKVAESNGVKCFDTFTGFKFMAEKKNALEASGEGKVIFSYEESYGYMLGDCVRDKDAVTASADAAKVPLERSTGASSSSGTSELSTASSNRLFSFSSSPFASRFGINPVIIHVFSDCKISPSASYFCARRR